MSVSASGAKRCRGRESRTSRPICEDSQRFEQVRTTLHFIEYNEAAQWRKCVRWFVQPTHVSIVLEVEVGDGVLRGTNNHPRERALSDLPGTEQANNRTGGEQLQYLFAVTSSAQHAKNST
jgi:hypothetical protein